MKRVHLSKFSIYYEDTDSTGLVYHTSYLKFAERARSNFLREKFPDLQNLLDFNDFFFVVKEMQINFLKSASLNQDLEIQTFFVGHSFCSINLVQKIFRSNLLLNVINVKLVWVDGKKKKPSKLSENIVARFNSLEVV